MKDKPVNLAASVRARLRNVARERSTDYQLILRRYAIERLLHRIGISVYRDRFVLKGAMLFTAWLADPFRPTKDLDLLDRGDPRISAIDSVFRAICRIESRDGLVFGSSSLSVYPIRSDRLHSAVRIKTIAFLGKTRIPVQVDVGFGDVITPSAQELEFPSLLASDGPIVKAYPRETVVAEKLHAITELGHANSRIKDYYDLLALSRLFPFDGGVLSAAIEATFNNRGTKVPTGRPAGLDERYAADPEKARQWNAFVGREPLLIEAPGLRETVEQVAGFAMPPLQAAATGGAFPKQWSNGGKWTGEKTADQKPT